MVNTWGAKGVFRWDDPHHFGTAGLQARDFELAGLGSVDLLVTSGLDPMEVTSAPWTGRATVIDIEPSDLATTDLAARADVAPWPVGSGTGVLERPALYTELAAVVGPLYERPGSPPARAAALAASLGPGGLVVAEPGLVGLWIARTFPTTEPGSVLVPATGGPGAARRLAERAATAGRPVTLVVPAAPAVSPEGVSLDVWDDVDLDPAPLVAVAGPVVAWI